MAGGRGSQGFPGTRLKAGLASVVGSRSLSGFNRALWTTGWRAVSWMSTPFAEQLPPGRLNDLCLQNWEADELGLGKYGGSFRGKKGSFRGERSQIHLLPRLGAPAGKPQQGFSASASLISWVGWFKAGLGRRRLSCSLPLQDPWFLPIRCQQHFPQLWQHQVAPELPNVPGGQKQLRDSCLKDSFGITNWTQVKEWLQQQPWAVKEARPFISAETSVQGDFPGVLVVKTPHFHCREHKFNPLSGN